VGPQHRRVLFGLEGRRSGQGLEQHTAQGIDIGPGVDVLPLDLLRGNVLDGPHELAGDGQAGV
jgi:hypothetical protein